MKHIEPNPFHAWFHGTREWGANSNRTVSFRTEQVKLDDGLIAEARVAYSYQTPIGMIVRIRQTGTEQIILCQTRYSNTTSKHQSMMERAVSIGAGACQVPQLAEPGSKRIYRLPHLINACSDKANELTDKAKRARSKQAKNRYIDEALRYADYANRLWYELKGNQNELLERDWHRILELVREYADLPEDAQKDPIPWEQRYAAKIAKWQERVTEWCEGRLAKFPGFAFGRLPWELRNKGQYLRIRDAETVETSEQATVPLADVRRALPVVLRLWDTGNDDLFPVPIPCALGHYGGTIRKDHVQVGCHKFTRAEVQRFAATLFASGHDLKEFADKLGIELTVNEVEQ